MSSHGPGRDSCVRQMPGSPHLRGDSVCHPRDAACRKTCGRGAMRTQIFDMTCSTFRLALWQGCLACRFNGRFLAIALCGKHNGALRTLARPPQTEYISMQALRAYSLTHHPHVVLDEHGEERWLPRKNCPAIRNAPAKRPNAPRRHGGRGRCCRPHASCSPYTTQDGTTIPSCTISRRPPKCPRSSGSFWHPIRRWHQ